MHRVPRHIDIPAIRNDIYGINGVHNVHHLHIWQLNDSKIIATMHIKLDKFVDVEETLCNIEKIFHKIGIHSTTIQIEKTDCNERLSNAACYSTVCNDENYTKITVANHHYNLIN